MEYFLAFANLLTILCTLNAQILEIISIVLIYFNRILNFVNGKTITRIYCKNGYYDLQTCLWYGLA